MNNLNTSTEVTQTTEPAIAVEPVLAPVFVYEFLYNSDCCESAASTISIHKTKKGAEMAIEFHKNEMRKEYEKMMDGAEGEMVSYLHYGYGVSWDVMKTRLLQ